MDDELDRDAAITAFLQEVASIPWFRNIGKPLPPDSRAKPIFQWKDWPGPEDPAIIELSQRHQSLHDSILAQFKIEREDLLAIWDRVNEAVFFYASPALPYSEEEDAWHGPTAALWHAAWTAGLIAWCVHLCQPIPADLQEQWEWYVLGRWPAGYSEVLAPDRPGPLLVY
jgi:hypothetical protein